MASKNLGKKVEVSPPKVDSRYTSTKKLKAKKSNIWYVYGVRCSDSTLYVGITNNLKARIEKHNKGTGAKYTRSRRPVRLLRSEKCPDIGSAMRRERELKKIGKVKKELWVGGEKISRRSTRIKIHAKKGIKGEYKRQKIKSKRILATDNGHGFTRTTTRFHKTKRLREHKKNRGKNPAKLDKLEQSACRRKL